MLDSLLRQNPEYTLVHVVHASDIFKHIAQRIVPLIIIDDSTVGIGSFALLHEIKRMSPDTRIVLIVPSTSPAQQRRAQEAGADYYMAQAFASYRLASIIGTVTK